MRPLLKSALRRVWRGPDTLQIGVDPERAVVLAGMDSGVARFMETLDGTRERATAIASAPALGLDEGRASEVLDLLDAKGLLDDAAADSSTLFHLPATERERLRPDLASLSLLSQRPGAALAVLARRRDATVRLFGAGRIGASVAALLSAAGVGRVEAHDRQPARPTDLSPCGLTPSELGGRRQDGVRAAVDRARAGPVPPPAGRAGGGANPDLVILAPVGALNPLTVTNLMRAGTPHLFLGIREITGVVGPLVVPGRSSCLRCHDHYRTDRDPAWPRIAAQLAARVDQVTATDTVLAVSVAALGALQALSFLDGGDPLALDGTLEIELPEGLPRRRSWQPHYACGCTWNQEQLPDRSHAGPP
jgi:hypothetical protein